MIKRKFNAAAFPVIGDDRQQMYKRCSFFGYTAQDIFNIGLEKIFRETIGFDKPSTYWQSKKQKNAYPFPECRSSIAGSRASPRPWLSLRDVPRETLPVRNRCAPCVHH